MTGSAFAFTPAATAGCANEDVYGHINRVIYNVNWYDDLIALAFTSGDFALTHPATRQLTVKAVHSDSTVSTVPASLLTFASSDTGKATVSASGLVTTVAAGATTIKATVTAASQWDCNVICTVS